MSIIRPGLQARSFGTTGTLFKAIVGQTKLEKAGLPVPPSGPRTSYTYFVTEHFAKHGNNSTQDSADFQLSDISRSIASSWRNLSQAEKDKYNKQAHDDTARYQKEFDAFYASLAPGQFEKIEEHLGRKVRVPGSRIAQRRKAQQTLTDAGAPPKPLTGFFLFLRELREKNPGPVVSLARDAGTKWKAMSEDEKRPYIKEAEDMKELYKAWEAQNKI